MKDINSYGNEFIQITKITMAARIPDGNHEKRSEHKIAKSRHRPFALFCRSPNRGLEEIESCGIAINITFHNYNRSDFPIPGDRYPFVFYSLAGPLTVINVMKLRLGTTYCLLFPYLCSISLISLPLLLLLLFIDYIFD